MAVPSQESLPALRQDKQVVQCHRRIAPFQRGELCEARGGAPAARRRIGIDDHAAADGVPRARVLQHDPVAGQRSDRRRRVRRTNPDPPGALMISPGQASRPVHGRLRGAAGFVMSRRCKPPCAATPRLTASVC